MDKYIYRVILTYSSRAPITIAANIIKRAVCIFWRYFIYRLNNKAIYRGLLKYAREL